MKTALVVVLSAVIALAVGVGLGYAVGSAGGGATSAEAADRAELACQGAEGLPDTFDEAAGVQEGYAVLGVGSLAQAAGEADPSYAGIGRAGEMVARTIQTLDTESYPGAVDDLRAACEDR